MPVLDRVIEQYPNQVKIAFKQFPLQKHKYAFKAAQATIAAHRQGKFWEYHDLVFKHFRRLSDQKIVEITEQLIEDKASFRKEMLAAQTSDLINTDIKDGRKAGVRGTPTVFVNGIQLSDKSLPGFKRAIDAILKK